MTTLGLTALQSLERLADDVDQVELRCVSSFWMDFGVMLTILTLIISYLIYHSNYRVRMSKT